ncbi:response regulator [Massilia sp. W12]|uniref:response regulator n=1 Tax=Massilia sp. W12 TaxID=3126507 RepID=UPI0030CBC23C
MKVLVVDDDVISRMALVDLMSSLGPFEIVEAEDGQQAWDLLQNGLQILLCCCDIRMPRLSGIEFLQRVKGDPLLNRLPVVLVSSASDLATVQQAIKSGATDYIIKPFNAQEAQAHLRKILKKVWSGLAEQPGAVMQRLNLNSERLQAYYRALQKQLMEARPILAQTAQDPVRKAKIDALHTGCLTLGMWHAASQIERLHHPQIKIEQQDAILQEAVKELEHQLTLATLI